MEFDFRKYVSDTRTVYCTYKYDLFMHSKENRKATSGRNRELEPSLNEHGFEPSRPVQVQLHPSGRLLVIDGQHRVEWSRNTGGPVWFMIMETEVTTAQLNYTSTSWTPRDYLDSHMETSDSPEVFHTIDEIAKKYKIPIATVTAAVLGTCSRRVASKKLKVGKLDDVDEADLGLACYAGQLYQEIGALNKSLERGNVFKCLVAIVKVRGFDVERFLKGVEKTAKRFGKTNDVPEILGYFESAYNHRMSPHKQFPLQLEANKILHDTKTSSKAGK